MAGSVSTSSVNPDSVTAIKDIDTSSGDFQNKLTEIASMATIPNKNHLKKSKLIDTYWIIPRNSNKPSSKVSFTRNDRRMFNVLFKDDRLIWAGRKPVMEA